MSDSHASDRGVIRSMIRYDRALKACLDRALSKEMMQLLMRLGPLSHSGRTREVLTESMDQARLIEALDGVLRRLGGTARQRRTDRLATVIRPGTADIQASFVPVAKHYGAVMVPCPPRRGNRKSAVECGEVHVRPVVAHHDRGHDGGGALSLDRFRATTGDARLRPPHHPGVGPDQSKAEAKT